MKTTPTVPLFQTRRVFIRQMLAAAIAPSVIPASVLGLSGKPAPSNRVVVAAIGLGFAWNMFLRRKGVQFVAVCDVQKARRDAAKEAVDGYHQNKDCRTYNDFREVLARPDVDAVYIATPDHWHALVTITAARAGKHIYCQKPLTRTIAEGQAVVEAVNRYGVVFQHGTQQRHDPKMLFGCELVRNGYIGQLKHVKIGSPAGATCGPQHPEPVPQGLDWDMWLGPAPWSPFTHLRIQSHPWYHISDYSLGYIAGWGVHHCDSAMQGSGLDDCDGLVEIDTQSEFPTDGLFDNPHRWQLHYKFPNGVTWHWTDCYDGSWGSRARSGWPQHPMGIRFEGTEGSVFIWREFVDAQPKSLLEVKLPPHAAIQLNRPYGEEIPDFIECVKRRLRTCAPVEVAQRTTNLCSIAAISMRLNRRLTWNTANEEFLNDPEADRLRSRTMREPWSL
jgi:predicted dehydrogenase